MIRRFALLALALVATCVLFGQDVEAIKRNKLYYYGEGSGESVEEADNNALNAIIGQISINVSSSTSSHLEEQVSGDRSLVRSSFETKIQSYTSATLNNAKQIIVKNRGRKVEVFRYILRSDVERIFAARRHKISEMVEDASSALERGQINDALRYYYWAYALTRSLPSPNEMRIRNEDGDAEMASQWLPVQIEQILSNIEIRVKEFTPRDAAIIEILYRGKAVRSIDYSYFDGFGWSNIYSGQDGLGVIELRKKIDTRKIQLKIEYSFESEAVVDPEVDSVIEFTERPSFKRAYINLSLDTPAESPITPPSKRKRRRATSVHEEAISEHLSSLNTTTTPSREAIYPTLTSEVRAVEEYRKVIDRVTRSIAEQKIEGVAELFTERGLEAFVDLVGYGSARVVDLDSPKFYAFGESVYCRNIYFRFSFANNHKSFIEGLVFEFDRDRKISNVTFSLSSSVVDHIFTRMTMWSEAARIILIHFIEGYKSAYALKQLDYIESVFADDALIITGNVARRATKADVARANLPPQIEYTRQSKREYMERLRRVFATNEFVNLKFTDCDILKAGVGGEIYGIQIKQEYSSSRYGDTGYLFLMVDLNDISRPIIHVRTWQEMRDSEFGIYGLEHFN